METIEFEAAKHGRLVREFTDLGLPVHKNDATLAWSRYQATLSETYLRVAQRAYWAAYSSNPIHFQKGAK